MHNMKRRHHLPAWLLYLLVGSLVGPFVSCAKQAPPPGGPEDKTPPRILSVSPAGNAERVALDAEIEIRFSERIEPRSIRSSLFITPYLGELEYKWSGSRLRIRRSQPLRENTTYVVTVGSEVRDLRNNPMEQSFTWAFATGDSLNKGRIKGRVFEEGRVQGILVWAYLLGDRAPNPAKDPADYVTQTDSKGGYELTYLAPTRYRLFAVRDQNNSRLYEPGVDALGVATHDVFLNLTSQSEEGLNFRLAVHDTTAPALDTVSAPNRNHLELRFSEPLSNEGTADPTNFEIDGEDTLGVRLAYQDAHELRRIHLVTDPQRPDTTYTVTVHGLRDAWGLTMDSLKSSLEFRGEGKPDTVRPRVVQVTPVDSASGIAFGAPVEILFSEAMDTSATSSAFGIADTAERAVAGMITWPSVQKLRFLPRDGWGERSRYRVSLELSRCLDLFGNSAADSSEVSTFTTLSRDTLSAISGHVSDTQAGARGPIHLRARRSTRDPGYQVMLADTGSYEFDNILPGVYGIDGFRDSDGDGSYSWGSSVPYEPAERFVVYPDSIVVRARWPNEGNDIQFGP